MKLLVVLLLLVGCTTRQWEVGFHAANAGDVVTTLHGLDEGCIEASPLTGSHPDKGTVIGIAIAQSVLAEVVCRHAGASERLCWQAFTVIKLGATAWNASQDCH